MEYEPLFLYVENPSYKIQDRYALLGRWKWNQLSVHLSSTA